MQFPLVDNREVLDCTCPSADYQIGLPKCSLPQTTVGSSRVDCTLGMTPGCRDDSSGGLVLSFAS